MEKLLKFYKDIGKYDDKIYTYVTGEALTIALQVDTGRTTDYFATVQHENGTKVYLKAKNKIFTIPENLLKFGAIDMTITAQVGNNVVKKFYCEQLLVKEVDGGIKVVPEILELRQCVENLKGLVNGYQSEVNQELEKFDKVLKSALMGE